MEVLVKSAPSAAGGWKEEVQTSKCCVPLNYEFWVLANLKA